MHKHLGVRKRYRGWRFLALISVFVIGYLGLLISAVALKSHSVDSYDPIIDIGIESYSFRKLLSENTTDGGFQYPPEVFTLEERRDGAVVLHVIGLIYMFIALAIVCDEFFVPSLSVIIEKLDISEDVAGATFMAAGGSAPELFTSLFGVFFARNNVGIGTIVGSAVFNILFVIGMCAIVSKEVLDLTWWPLFRDVTFYSIDLIVLVVFFRKGYIVWWNALILFLLYISYVLFMKFNIKIESFVKTKILRRKTRVHSNDSLLNEQEIIAKRKPHRSCSIPIIHSGTNHFRHGVLQLMIHTIDPISETHVQDKAMKLHAVASVNLLIDTSDESLTNAHSNGDIPNGVVVKKGDIKNGGVVADKNSNNSTKPQMRVNAISNGVMPNTNSESPNFSRGIVSPTRSEDGTATQGSSTRTSNNTDTTIVDSPQQNANVENGGSSPKKDDDDDDEPLDMSWPTTWRKRITYVLLAPLTFPMWLTLPDTRRPEKKRWYMGAFFGSIFWIMIFSYLMVWWANEIGETIGIEDEIMGLTILAAGTSIPDLITSVIVAKKGLGDMAVSSSVGSNIFDITVGLPVPWLLYSAIYNGKTISVDSEGLVCSILLLFAMLLVVVVTIGASKWKMTKIMGFSMLGMYCAFLVLSVLLELAIVNCPVT